MTPKPETQNEKLEMATVVRSHKWWRSNCQPAPLRRSLRKLFAHLTPDPSHLAPPLALVKYDPDFAAFQKQFPALTDQERNKAKFAEIRNSL